MCPSAADRLTLGQGETGLYAYALMSWEEAAPASPSRCCRACVCCLSTVLGAGGCEEEWTRWDW